jgi:hypothetical protein
VEGDVSRIIFPEGIQGKKAEEIKEATGNPQGE